MSDGHRLPSGLTTNRHHQPMREKEILCPLDSTADGLVQSTNKVEDSWESIIQSDDQLPTSELSFTSG
jgi:hypothetical protein